MIETNATLSIGTVVDGYFAMWNELDPQQRQEVIASTWVPEASYSDPLFAVEGYQALDALVEGVHQQFPGHQFRLIGSIDVHHDRARWNWELAAPNGNPPVAVGVDFAILAPDGRLRTVTGFFEQVASAA